MVLVARTETPPKGTSIRTCDYDENGLIDSGKEIRVYGDGPSPFIDDTAKVSSHDALWRNPRMSPQPS